MTLPNVVSIVMVLTVIGWQAQGSTSTHKTSPVTKVITMLNDMLAKAKAEKNDEEVRYAEFKAFCGNTISEKQKAIEEGKDNIEELQAVVQKAESDTRVMVKKIASLDNDVQSWKNDVKVAMTKRKEEEKLFKQTHLEYQESLEAVERALDYLSKPGKEGQAFAQIDRSGMFGASLLELSSSTRVAERQQLGVSEKQRLLLKAFLKAKGDAREALIQEAHREGIELANDMESAEDTDSDDDSGAPEAKAWESSSGAVIDMVEKLGDKFEDEKMELEKREANQMNAHKLMMADVTAQIKAAEKASQKKVSEKQQVQKAKAEADGELQDGQAGVAEDEKFVSDLQAECHQKAMDFEEKQSVRKGEIDAIGKAIDIMSKVVSPTFIQLRRPTALAQFRSRTETSNRKEVVDFLRERGNEMHSRLLMLIAQKASVDPFAKVKKMIEEMIVKLMESGNEAAEHKAFCDTELGTNQQTRESKTADAESIAANLEQLTADMSRLSDQITGLSEELVAIDASVAKATADRDAEKAKNVATIQDATVAAQATASALAVLKDSYNKAAEPVGQPAPQQGPIKWDTRSLAIITREVGGSAAGAPPKKEPLYTGQANGGVLGLLEVIESDFTKLATETEASDQEAARQYEQFMSDSSEAKAVKTADMKHRENERTSKQVAHGELKKNLRIIHEELDAALQYYEKLKPSCENPGPTYEERKEQRDKEIQSLKEALEILGGNGIYVDE
jgi:hypothetical protein